KALYGIGEVAHKVAPPQFSVGKQIKPKLFLLFKDAQDMLVLYSPQGVRIGVRAVAGLQQFLRPQKASDVVCSIFNAHLLQPPSSRALVCHRASRVSYPELLVDRQALLAAVGDVVVDEPKDVKGLNQVVAVVDKLQRTVEPEYGLHAIGVIGNQRMYRARTFLYIAAGTGNPIVLQVPPAPFKRASKNPSAMTVPVQPSPLF